MTKAGNFHRGGRFGIGVTVAFALALAVPAHADTKEHAGEGSPAPPSAADFAKLQKEVAEQRQLIIQMLQMEQQRYDFLLKLLQSGGAQIPPGTAMPPPPPAAATGTSGAASVASSERAAASVAPVTGRVQSASGPLKDAYVYVDLVRGSSARGRTLEIKQKDKQFWPQVAVVQRGTSVKFPNLDPVYHNVFSHSPGNSFDLGSYRAGEATRAVTLTTPGVVDVYCNIHSRMTASVLVVPNALYTKVGADGNYRIENVPTGVRKIVAWSPNAKPAAQKIEVTSAGGQASFTLQFDAPSAHTNKLGQPYGSYKE